MKCPECGSEVGPDEKFCGNCGAPTEGAQEPELAPPAEDLPIAEPGELPGDETVIAEAEAFSLPEAEPPPAPEAPAFEPEPPATGGEPEFVPPPAPPPPPPAPPPPPPAEGKDNKKIWIIVAVVAVLLLCCCCIAGIAGFLLFTEAGQDLLGMQALPSLMALI